MKSTKRLTKPTSLRKLLMKFDIPKQRYITKEYQLYGLKLAEELDDWEHKSLYIRLAKQIKRPILEDALYFVKGADKVKNKAKLFMWKLKQIKAIKS